jgi:hypothetical protein
MTKCRGYTRSMDRLRQWNIMERIYIVEHEHELSEDSSDVKFIGVYLSRPDAEEAVKRALTRPGFKDYPDGFTINETVVGEDHWPEGFFTWRPKDESH